MLYPQLFFGVLYDFLRYKRQWMALMISVMFPKYNKDFKDKNRIIYIMTANNLHLVNSDVYKIQCQICTSISKAN